MATSTLNFFNFYRRYRWTAQNFTDLQTSLIALSLDRTASLYGKSVTTGLTYVSNSGLATTVSLGLAVDNVGNPLVQNGSNVVTFASPSGNPCKSLVVIRSVLTSANNITRPTSPFDTVALNQVYTSQVVVINGTPAASPVYPATLAGDVVLFGVSLATGASTFAASAVDYFVRDRVGKNTHLGKLTKYDYIVGNSPIATHLTLAAFCADTTVVAGSLVLVLTSEVVNTTLTVSIAGLRFEFHPGVIISQGSATTGMSLAATGIRIVGGLFSNFTTAAISIANGFNSIFISECRFASCTNDVTDLNTTPNNAIFGNITE